ncbi:hypothetical protein [Tranquillimonas alkanivorans]|uniref:Uncharacterized protein n=1 Tax=Tranquillimonas alkanivorans TaxID=441119 RepID=A0A1I5L0Z7_9RHOB|nr:hypothetical protein [Tranquillimonas alkanivorans]SFO90967.1 hypothetical protein SAMN04488047_101408 [Tranquillimonas alkanivorans]
MRVLNFPSLVRFPLPRHGEELTVYPADGGRGGRLIVDGFNRDRGFGWHVGTFDTWPEAMAAARQHRDAEVDLAQQVGRRA